MGIGGRVRVSQHAWRTTDCQDLTVTPEGNESKGNTDFRLSQNLVKLKAKVMFLEDPSGSK